MLAFSNQELLLRKESQHVMVKSCYKAIYGVCVIGVVLLLLHAVFVALSQMFFLLIPGAQ